MPYHSNFYDWRKCSECREEKYIAKEDSLCLACYKRQITILETKILIVKTNLSKWKELITKRHVPK